MGYKFICVDMDGTLLNSNKDISERTKESIKKAHEIGVKIAISTGRIFTSANYYADIIGVKSPVIASNGAYIREKDSDRIIYKNILGIHRCREILELFREFNIVPHFFTDDSIYTERLIYSSAYYDNLNKSLPIDRRINIEIIDNWEKIFEKQQGELLKAVAIDNDSENILRAKEKIKKLSKFEVVSSMPNNFEIMSEGASKGRGVEILCNYYGIDREEVICIGDSENDLSMIKFAGLGVAMNNGERMVKENAQYITDSNDEDGVAKVIEKFILDI